MARDYATVLGFAEGLQRYTGYLDSVGREDRARKQSELLRAARATVYVFYQDSNDYRALRAAVSADLDRIAAEGCHSAGAIEEARHALFAELAAQSGNPAMRHLKRWGPLLLGFVALVVFMYFKDRQSR